MKNLNQKQNDGTDPKKNDGNVDATQRSCFICIKNSTSSLLTDVVLVHKSGSRITTIEMPQMNPCDFSEKARVVFETGSCADFDYWNISFTLSDNIYDTPYNDRCNISYEDAGRLVECIVTEDGSNYNLKIHMPVSSNCNFVINKK